MINRSSRARFAVVTALVAALGTGGLAGCAAAGGSGSAAASATESTASETEATSVVESTTGATEAASVVESTTSATEGQETGMANPWRMAQTAAEASQGAGVGSFEVADELEIGGVKYGNALFFYMDGIAQATYGDDADVVSTVVVRKSNTFTGKEGLAGDYNEYPETWTQNHKGLEISCYGNKQDAAQLIMWKVDNDSYSIGLTGTGEGAEPTMTPDEVASLVSEIQ